jgi:hypothetical protein
MSIFEYIASGNLSEAKKLIEDRLEQIIFDKLTHLKKELSLIQALTDTEKGVINKLRALTTNQITEGAYFTENGKKYYVNVSIHESI